MCFFFSLVSCRLNRASLLIKAPLSTSRARDERRRGGARVDRWTTLLLNQASADLWPPKCIRMAVVTATQTLDPSARHDEDSQTQRRDFLSICHSLQSLQFLCYGSFSTGFVTSSGLRVASVPQPPKTCEPKHLICTRTHTPVALIYFPRVWRHECVCAHGWLQHCTEVAFQKFTQFEIRHTQKSSHLKTLPQNEPGYDLQKSIYWEINLFFQVNVFVKTPIQSLTDCTVKQCFLEDLRIHSQEYQRLLFAMITECLAVQRRKFLRCNQRSINVILHSTQIFKGF